MTIAATIAPLLWAVLGPCALGAAGVASVPAWVVALQPVPDAGEAVPTDALALVLADAAATPEARTAAAHEIVRRAELSVTARARVSELLDGSDVAGAAVLDAMARRSVVDQAMLPTVAPLVHSPGPLRLRAIAAAGSIRTVSAAEALAGVLDGDAEVRTAAEAALVRLTGQEQLGTDAGAWRLWIEANRARWDAVLAESHAARADRLTRRLAAAERALVDATRRAYLSSPPDQRSAALAAMLLDPLPAVRVLGFELVDREASAGRDLGDQVGPALLELMRSPSAPVRGRAAGLALRLAPAGVEAAIEAALTAEADPAAALPLLAAAGRWPSPGTLDPTLRWLARGDAPSRESCEALLGAVRLGLVQAPQRRSEALDALARVPVAALPAPGLRALAMLVPADGLAGVEALLRHEDAAVRRRAAEALSARPEALPMLLSAAANDAALLPSAAAAVRAFDPSANGVAAVAGGPWPGAAERRAAVAEIAAGLETPVLLAASDLLAPLDPAREDLFAAALARRDRPSSERAECLVRLAELRLSEARFDGAIAALDALTEGEADSEQSVRADRVRSVSVLAMGDDTPDAPAELWIAAFERTLGTDRGEQIRLLLNERFDGVLRVDQRLSLTTLTARHVALRAAEQPAPDADGPGPTP